MRLGLIARSEDRGLGVQTWEFARHMHPDRVLLVDMGLEANRGFEPHYDRFPGATVARFAAGEFTEPATVMRWLRDVDVVFSVETLYDWRLADWARAAGARTVVHVNPEFYKHATNAWPHPDVWWAPTEWRVDKLPAGTVIVPVPVPTDRFTPRLRTGATRTFLHVVGHAAAGDRAGTTVLLRALRVAREPMTIIIHTQDPKLPAARQVRRNITLDYRIGGIDDYWRLYDEGECLIAPRRYGGLSLVNHEAAAAGLGLILPDTSPHPATWPGRFVETEARSPMATGAGHIAMREMDPLALAATLDELARRPTLVEELSAGSLQWAAAHSWAALEPLYRRRLDEVAARRPASLRGGPA